MGANHVFLFLWENMRIKGKEFQPGCPRERNRLIAHSPNSTKCSMDRAQYWNLACITVQLGHSFHRFQQIQENCKYSQTLTIFLKMFTKYWKLVNISVNEPNTKSTEPNIEDSQIFWKMSFCYI